MLRVVKTRTGVRLDARHNLPGRGAYVHHDAECFGLAVSRGGLARTLKCQVPSGLLATAMQDLTLRDTPRGSKDS